MNIRNDSYYSGEASVYSKKRYPLVVQNYVQFLFTHRRDIVLDFVGRVISLTSAPRALCEMGCADGVLLRAIEEKYKGAFASIVGSDVSYAMIEMARELTHYPHISYVLRDSLPKNAAYTCAMEVGVGALVLRTSEELDILAQSLKQGGYLICSIAGVNSFAALRGDTAAHRSALKTYASYEADMQKLFTIEAVRSCGVAVPLLWKVPAAGRLLQPLIEYFGELFPERAHERVYLLKKIA